MCIVKRIDATYGFRGYGWGHDDKEGFVMVGEADRVGKHFHGGESVIVAKESREGVSEEVSGRIKRCKGNYEGGVEEESKGREVD